MTDIINEKWELRVDEVHEEVGDHCDYMVLPVEFEGDEEDVWVMRDTPYYPDAPPLPVAQHIVDIHNFIVEHGGLESVRAMVDASVAQHESIGRRDPLDELKW